MGCRGVLIAPEWGELEDEARAWRERRHAADLPVDCRPRFETKFKFQMNSNLPQTWIKQMKAFPNPKDGKQNKYVYIIE
jgi:hypothetical protein